LLNPGAQKSKCGLCALFLLVKMEPLYLEANLKPNKTEAFEGREWDVTIIGKDPKRPESYVEVNGRGFIRSLNSRLYAVEGLKNNPTAWDGTKVYDNHLTQEEFEQKQGMRSPVKEWLGTIVQPYWDDTAKQLRGVFKVVEASLAAKLKSAWEQGVLGAIGLSIDTFPIVGESVMLEGKQFPIIEGFEKILSVDLVGDPAAGGGFNRLIASVTTQDHKENIQMDEEKLKALFEEGFNSLKSALPEIVKPLVAEALAADETEEAQEGEQEAKKGKGKKKMPMEMEMEEATKEAKLARTELMLERKLNAAKLPEAFIAPIRQVFAGRIVTEKEVDDMIKTQKEAQASLDPTGRVTESGQQRVTVGLDPTDKFAVEFMRLMMGNTEFETFRRATEHHALVDERLSEYRKEARFLEAWEKDGKPEIRSFRSIPVLIETWLGGNPVLDNRALEAISTSSLATVLKNTINILVANDYSKKHTWYEPLVRTEEVDSIQDATLARLFGVNTLSVVEEGAAYTEMGVHDEEETAAFVKKGNYIGVTLETLMKENKVNFIRTIPMRMSNAWYNTLSAATAAVFTVNSNTGPVLSDTGALFNSTAASSAGGHANLLTTAFSYSGYSAARTAMRKQTDQPLGAGQKLQITPKYLLVPEDLEVSANTVRNSELIPGSANNDVNQFKGAFEVVVVPVWTDANDWALVADPAQYPAIWHIFPRGGRTPSLFTADSEVTGAMFTNDEMRFKIRQTTYRFSSTYECSPVSDWRPLHKNNVA
jgi:hypothetical protein